MGAQCRASRMPDLKFLRTKRTYLGGPGSMLSMKVFDFKHSEKKICVFLLIILGI